MRQLYYRPSATQLLKLDSHSKHPCRTAHTRDEIFKILKNTCYHMSACPYCRSNTPKVQSVIARERHRLRLSIPTMGLRLSRSRCQCEWIEIAGEIHVACYRAFTRVDKYAPKDAVYKSRLANESSCSNCGASWRVPMPRFIMGTRAKRSFFRYIKKMGAKERFGGYDCCPFAIVGWHRPHGCRC